MFAEVYLLASVALVPTSCFAMQPIGSQRHLIELMSTSRFRLRAYLCFWQESHIISLEGRDLLMVLMETFVFCDLGKLWPRGHSADSARAYANFVHPWAIFVRRWNKQMFVVLTCVWRYSILPIALSRSVIGVLINLIESIVLETSKGWETCRGLVNIITLQAELFCSFVERHY
jgi:hypothetical protein